MIGKKQNSVIVNYNLYFVVFIFISSIFSALILSSNVNDLFISSSDKEFNSNLKINDYESIQQISVSIPRVDNSNVIIDGNIDNNEYQEYYNDATTGIITFWEHNTVNLTIGFVSPSLGWVSLGIGDVMNGSNMIIGGFMAGSVYAVDLVGLPGWSHGNDTDHGGFDDILEAEATENTTHTIFEFIIPLNSSDPLDPVLQENGTSYMFIGNADSDDISPETYEGGHHGGLLSVLLRSNVIIVETTIALTISSNLIDPFTENQRTILDLRATLTDTAQNPIEDMLIQFFIETQFGYLIFDTDSTDSLGKVNTSYTHPSLTGNFTFGAKFNEILFQGTFYKSCEINELAYIQPGVIEGAQIIRSIIGLTTLAIAAIALVIVWLIYAYNGLSVVSFLFIKSSKQLRQEKRPKRD